MAGMAWTSTGAKVNENFASSRNGVYTYRIEGALSHEIGSLLAMEDQEAKFSQIYFLDGERQDQRRSDIYRISEATFGIIRGVLEQVANPFVNVWRQAKEILASNISIKILSKIPTSNADPRTYQTPAVPEVAALIVDHDDNEGRDLILRKSGGGLQRIRENSPFYDALSYPILFPHGNHGWHNDMKKVSLMNYSKYRLQARNGTFNILHHTGRLTQQYIVDTYARIDQERLNYLRTHQKDIRAELYQGLQDHVNANDGHQIGQRIVLPASYIGGPRNMDAKYQDAMALVRKFGKPDLFITITCNPQWKEIQSELLPTQKAEDRPDIVVRVFKLKLDAALHEIKMGIFGEISSYSMVVEFQKRGLPHAHITVTLKNKIVDPDEFVSAQIPDEEVNPILYEKVASHMVHGPCGVLNPRSPCMKESVCSKKYPKALREETIMEEDGFCEYSRPRNDRFITKNRRNVNNGYIVPFNPYLLVRYDCHVNVEICSTTMAVKYLFKYMNKGSDRLCSIFDGEDVDEIQRFLDSRYITPPEACWRIFGYGLHCNSHTVERLPVHLEQQQNVVFREGAPVEELQNVLEGASITKLTAFFSLCSTDAFASDLLYFEVPEHYTWDQRGKRWKARVNQSKTVGRMHMVNPSAGERYYLRVLLCNVSGPTSFENLKTVDGTLHPTFKDAAIALGLLENDAEWVNCLNEAALVASAAQMRQLFATILVFCAPADVKTLFDLNLEAFSEDLVEMTDLQKRNQVCSRISDCLIKLGKQYSDFPGLPEFLVESSSNRLIAEEECYTIKDWAADVEKLNEKQQICFSSVYDSVVGRQEPRLFFLDGPGGTGKTFVYNVLLNRLRSEGHICLAVASSGIAAELLEGGRTAHSRFKISTDIKKDSMCNIKPRSAIAELLKRTKLIIWDEAPMTHKYVFDAVDRTLRDILLADKPMGGITTLFGGDFRQCLPVVPGASRGQMVNSSIKKSKCWKHVNALKLDENMRVLEGGQDHVEFLMKVGNGELSSIQVPREMRKKDLKSLINFVYPNIDRIGSNNVILTTKNKIVDDINNVVLEKLNAESSAEEARNLFPVEFLNSLSLSGLPQHSLKLKVGAPVMLLRNINPTDGLSNGTRMIVTRLGNNVIECQVSSGRSSGKFVLIHRVTLLSTNKELPFKLRRHQFPIRVGIYLPEAVFSHGQLYVALSRARRRDQICIVAPNNMCTNNVYKEVFRGHVDDSEDQDNHVEINIDYSEQTKGKRVEENTPVLTDEQYNMLYAMFYPNGGPSVAEFPDEVVKALF